MGRSRYKIYEEHYPYFITCSFSKGIALFADPEIADVVLDSLGYMKKEHGIQLYAYVLMQSSFHCILEGDNLSSVLRKFKSFTARRIIDYLTDRNRTLLLRRLQAPSSHPDSSYKVWQEGFHPKQIKTWHSAAELRNEVKKNTQPSRMSVLTHRLLFCCNSKVFDTWLRASLHFHRCRNSWMNIAFPCKGKLCSSTGLQNPSNTTSSVSSKAGIRSFRSWRRSSIASLFGETPRSSKRSRIPQGITKASTCLLIVCSCSIYKYTTSPPPQHLKIKSSL